MLLQLPEDNRNFWSVALTVKTAPKRDNRFTAAENFHKEITIQRITDEYGRDLVSYRLGADNVVRRWNGGDARAERQKEQELGIAPKFATAETTPDELFEMAQRAMADLVDFQIPNQRLETQMGLQNQPIDLEEFEGLHEMLSRPDLAPRTR
ncbi:MAG TPA: hypothetical protein VFL85_04500 [Candidatus Saccharimonadales bacterium]|nr:hypothetical protein [Candidatus Saccharimonadales bacterium]